MKFFLRVPITFCALVRLKFINKFPGALQKVGGGPAFFPAPTFGERFSRPLYIRTPIFWRFGGLPHNYWRQSRWRRNNVARKTRNIISRKRGCRHRAATTRAPIRTARSSHSTAPLPARPCTSGGRGGASFPVVLLGQRRRARRDARWRRLLRSCHILFLFYLMLSIYS